MVVAMGKLPLSNSDILSDNFGHFTGAIRPQISVSVQGLGSRGVAQDGLQGLHIRAGLDRKRGVCEAQRVNDQSFNILHAGITQGRRPYAIPPVGGGLPATSRSTQQIILSTLVLQQSLDHGQQLAGYGNEPGPVPLRKGFDQV